MPYTDPDAHRVVERATIRMPYCPYSLSPAHDWWPVVQAGSPMRLRRIAEQLARQFQRETHYDFPPFTAADPYDGVVVLLPAQRRMIDGARLIAGAVGIEPVDGAPGATWVYVHPYERGLELVYRAWPHIADQWPGVRLIGPFTPAGDRLRARLDESTD